jgi:hypothetical protein
VVIITVFISPPFMTTTPAFTMDFRYKLHSCTLFSVVNLVKDYHQASLAVVTLPKTAIMMSFGLFDYLFMPFRLKTTVLKFQQLINRVFHHLPCVFTYLDDNLIPGQCLVEHLDHLLQLFALLTRTIYRSIWQSVFSRLPKWTSWDIQGTLPVFSPLTGTWQPSSLFSSLLM